MFAWINKVYSFSQTTRRRTTKLCFLQCPCHMSWSSQAVLGAHGWAWGPWFGEGRDKEWAWSLDTSLWTVLHASPFCFLQSVLKKRDQVQAEYEAKLEAVALRKEDRPKVRDAPPGSGVLQAAVALPSDSYPSIQGCVRASTALFLFPFMCYFLEFLMCTWGWVFCCFLFVCF